jgi:hypothetical protein
MGEYRAPGYTIQTSKIGPGPPRVQAGPLEWDPDPPMGFGPPTMGSQGSRTEHTRALIRTQVGVWYRHVSRLDLVITYTPPPRSGRDPKLPRGVLRAA